MNVVRHTGPGRITGFIPNNKASIAGERPDVIDKEAMAPFVESE